MKIFKNVLKVSILAAIALIIIFIPSLAGGKWVIPVAILALILIKAKLKKTALFIGFILVVWAAYAYGGRQGQVPGFINRAESAIVVGVNELEDGRVKIVENAHLITKSAKLLALTTLASDLPQMTATVATPKPTPEPQIEVTLEPSGEVLELVATGTLNWDGKTCVPTTLKVKVHTANLRPKPQISEAEPPLAVLTQGEEVTVSGKDGAWLKVKFYTIEGWMSQSTLENFTCKASP